MDTEDGRIILNDITSVGRKATTKMTVRTVNSKSMELFGMASCSSVWQPFSSRKKMPRKRGKKFNLKGRIQAAKFTVHWSLSIHKLEGGKNCFHSFWKINQWTPLDRYRIARFICENYYLWFCECNSCTIHCWPSDSEEGYVRHGQVSPMLSKVAVKAWTCITLL